MKQQTAQKPIIQIKGLHKNYRLKDKEAIALENINLDIYSGEIFGIIGMSGAGKSTLVRCINFLEKPTAGTVIFDDRDLSTLSEKELCSARQSMGMIFQQFNLLMQRNALKNICFPMEIAGVPKADAQKRAKELLALVGLSDKATAYPAQLSGGQKQRIAIARALATNPKVLLCDEATSALDPTTTRSILSLLKDINQRLGITIIIITHEMSVIEEICQRVAIIADHEIAEVGKVEDIFTKPQAAATKKLVYPESKKTQSFERGQYLRIVFDGSTSFEPIIANMIIDLKESVNIIFADTKNIDGRAFGQTVIQMPDDKRAVARIVAYLRNKNLTVEEVCGNDIQ